MGRAAISEISFAARSTISRQDIIRSERLSLIPMNLAFVDAILHQRRENAERALDVRLTSEWPIGQEQWLLRRLAQLHGDPSCAPWLTRATCLHDGTLIGRIGFHEPPNSDGETEFGYEIDNAFRGRGYAREAVRALLTWGFADPRLQRAVGCVAPDNAISIHMLSSFGFVFDRVVQDEEDGEEHRYVLERRADL